MHVTCLVLKWSRKNRQLQSRYMLMLSQGKCGPLWEQVSSVKQNQHNIRICTGSCPVAGTFCAQQVCVCAHSKAPEPLITSGVRDGSLELIFLQSSEPLEGRRRCEPPGPLPLPGVARGLHLSRHSNQCMRERWGGQAEVAIKKCFQSPAQTEPDSEAVGKFLTD